MPTAPDPNALRRDRKDDLAWTQLTPRDLDAAVPEFPLARPTERDLYWWREVWAMPQANEWEKTEEHHAVALYVRLLARSEAPDAPITAMRPLMQLREELGLSVTGRRRRRWLMPGEQTAASKAADRGRPGRVVPLHGRQRPSARDRFRNGYITPPAPDADTDPTEETHA
ncbi:hypothetical protein [Geodermatophilus chilensis]|uniref:hypothetical protein n=1 Tax=Geodermatophilus chilensis TaxID=2035835 RepID=UPI000C26449D|nr:hypothetical protein [Geodermatophilus chilensis]